MIKDNEKSLINIIRYGPMLFVVILSVLSTLVIKYSNDMYSNKEIERIKELYIQSSKKEIQKQIYEAYNYIKKEHEDSLKNLKSSLKDKVYEAHTIASKIYEINKDKMSNDKILELIKITLGSIIFNEGRAYYFINDKDGNILLHPQIKANQDRYSLETQQIHGHEFIKKIVKNIEDKTEKFDTHVAYKEDDNTKYQKLSFHKYFEPLNISIGAGEYLKDFKKRLKERILNHIQSIRFSDDNYLFIYDYKGFFIAHKNPKVIGRNYLNTKTINNYNVIQRGIDLSKQGEGFFEYKNPTFDKQKLYMKTSFVKGYQKWGWVIGTGYINKKLLEDIESYKKEFENKNEKEFNRLLLISGGIIFILLLGSFYFSRRIENIFISYKNRLNDSNNLLKQEIKTEVQKNIDNEILIMEQSKLASMGEMIGNIAHQWRQPLAVTNLAVSVIKERNQLGILEKEHHERKLNDIEKNLQYMSQTIEDFLNYFKPNKKKTYFNLDENIKKVLNLLSVSLENKNIKLKYEVNSDLKVYGYEDEFVQVVMSIVNNAIQVLDDKKEKKLEIKALKKDKSIFVEVSDSGGGVAKNIQNKIFEPYFTTKHQSNGTGLGLYMSKMIVEKSMNGKLSVQNTKFGAKFIIEFKEDKNGS